MDRKTQKGYLGDMIKKALKKLTKSYYKKKAWKHFSEYIRLRDSDHRGICKCCTCGKEASWKGGEIHAGHFVQGRGSAVLFREDITHAQCAICNMWGNGEQAKYFLFMKRKYNYSDEYLEDLLNLKHNTIKYSAKDYDELSDKYLEKVISLVAKRDC